MLGGGAGLTPDDVRRQGEEIASANAELAFPVLRGIECDIRPNGRLELPDDVLAELDWVQARVHGGSGCHVRR
jgi:DNA polymerase (family 10)